MTSTSPPRIPPIAIADAALVAVAERRRTLREARERFLATADADGMHDVRVAIRRLRAALSLFGPDVELPRRCRDRRLRRLGHRLAPLRDADILRAAVTSDEAAAAGVDADLIEHAEALRREALVEAEAVLLGRRTRRLLRGLRKWERRPRLTVAPDDLIGPVLPARLRARAEAFAEHPAWSLKLRRDDDGRLEDTEGVLDRAGVERALHSLRRRAKKIRYELEIAAPLLGLDDAPAVAHLTAIQDALGELQDICVIEAALSDLAPVQQPGEVFNRWLRDRRYRALEQWRRLRRRRADPVLALLPESALPGAD